MPPRYQKMMINGEGNVGQTIGSTSNLTIARSSVTFLDPETRAQVADPIIADNGEKKGLQGDLITCSGEVTTELFRLGKVTVVFEFKGFIPLEAIGNIGAIRTRLVPG
jgi:hypothetical protein